MNTNLVCKTWQNKTNVFTIYDNNGFDIVEYIEIYLSNITPNLITRNTFPNLNKFFVIDNIKTFEKFNKYYVKYDRETDKNYVQWQKLAKNYLGFYIDHTNENLRLYGKYYILYKDKTLHSWWTDYNILNPILFNPKKVCKNN